MQSRNHAADRFLELIGRQRHHVSDQHLVRVGGAARQHLHAVERNPLVVFRGHPQSRLRQPLGQIVVLVARTLRRNDRIGCEQVVAPDMLVDGQEIVAVATGLAVEHLRLHGKSGQIAGEGIGRAAHQAEAEVGDLAVGAVATTQILLRARLQVVHAVALAALLKRHDVAQRRIRLHVEQRGVGARAIGEGGVRGLILHPLLADIDDAAVTDTLQIFLSGHEHEREPSSRSFPRPSDFAWMIAIFWILVT
jgi:hypothetical protein